MGSGLRQSAGKSDLYLSIYLSIFVSLNLTFEQIDVGQALLKREKGLILTAARMGSGLRQSAGKSDLYLSIYLSIFVSLNLTFEQIDAGQALLKEKTKRVEG